ncbi:MAG: CRTAC1 family protein [Acidobacteriota bacterium]
MTHTAISRPRCASADPAAAAGRVLAKPSAVTWLRLGWASAALCALTACAPAPAPEPEPEAAPAGTIRFAEIAADAGLEFRHFDAVRAALLPEDNGSGLAFGDYDNDGFDDLYLVNFAGPALAERSALEAERQGGRLFRNLGDGTFRDVTEASGTGHVGWDNGVLWLDFDGDGWLDLLITGIDKIVLLRNRGDGTFEDRSRAAGLGVIPCEAMGAAAADYDRDGDLDIYIPCYVDFPWERARNRPLVGGRPGTMTTPANYPPQPNLLLRNEGDGRFEQVAAEAGVDDPQGRGLQAAFADLDDDGWPDLYVANDQSFDRLFRNQGGTFVDVTENAGTRDPRAGMGIGLSDYDGDGRPDLFLTHWVGEENALYRNASDGSELLFEDLTFEEGLGPITRDLVGWGTGFRDFDLDGDADLFLVNGSTVEDEWTLEVLTEPKMIPQRQMVYAREAEGFREVSESAGEIFEELFVGRGMSFADIDRDGLVDLAVLVHNGEPLLLHNRSERLGNWLAVQLVGTGSNRWAVGAKVVVRATTADGQEQVHTAWRMVGESYLGTHSTTLHFGLGEVAAADVEIIWPDGSVARFESVPLDRSLIFDQASESWREVPAEPVAPQPWGESFFNQTGD